MEMYSEAKVKLMKATVRQWEGRSKAGHRAVAGINGTMSNT